MPLEILCAQHAGSRATHRCYICGQALCPVCVTRGPRIDRCRLCGELAVSLEVVVDRSEEGVAVSEGWPERLTYPLRGIQGLLMLIFTVGLGVATAIEAARPDAALLLALPRFLVVLLLPGVMGDIVRCTVEGEDRLRGIPDYDLGRLWELIGFELVALYGVFPAVLAVNLAGCASLQTAWPFHCQIVVALGLALGAVLWVPAFGAFGASPRIAIAVHLPHHLEAVRRNFPSIAPLAAACGAAMASMTLADLLLPGLPGSFLQIALGIYSAFLGSHLAGIYVRENRASILEIYDTF